MESTNSLRDMSHTVWRHKGKAVLFFTAVMIAVALYTFLSPRTYRSEAKLFLRLGRDNATLDPTATMGEGPVVIVPQSRENEINSVIEILKSRTLVENVVDSVGVQAIFGRESPHEAAPVSSDATPESPAPDRDEAIRTVLAQLDVEAVKRSNIVVITYEGPSPQLSQVVVSRLVDFYLERHLTLNRMAGAHKFLAEQAERLRSQLAHSEEELRDLKNETGLGVPESQRQLLATRIGRLEDDLLQTTTALSAGEAELQMLRDKQGALSPTEVNAQTKGMPNVAADAMRAQLYALELKEQELLTIHPDKNPEVQAVRQQTASARAILEKEEGAREQVTVGPNRVYEEVQIALCRQEPAVAALRARAAALKEQLARERERLKTMTEDQLQIARRQREVDLQEGDYRKYAGSLEQAKIDEALEQEKISNIQVVQPASCDPKAVRPRMTINFGAGFAFALSVGVAAALLADKLGRKHKPRGAGATMAMLPEGNHAVAR